MTMNYAFSTLACPDWSLDQIIDAAANFGYDGIELRLLDGEVLDLTADADKVEHAVTRCRSQQVDVCALDTSCRFSGASAKREREVKSLLAWIRLAERVQVPLLRVFGGASGEEQGIDADEADARVAESLRKVVLAAKHTGITVMLETHDAYSSARRVAHVLDLVDAPCVAALWDSLHPYRMGETHVEVIALLGSRIAHVHVKDARRVAPAEPGNSGSDWQLVPLGEGEVPVRAQLTALEQLGYTGWVSVEWEKKWHPELAGPDVALPQHIAWLR